MAPSSGTGVTGSGSSTRTSGMIPNGAGVSQGTGVGANTSGMRATSGSMATPAIANPPTAMGQTVPGSNTQTQPPAGNNDMMTLLQMLGNGLTSNLPGPSIGSGGGTPASVSPPPTPVRPTAATPSTQDPFLSSLLAALTTTPVGS
ncbi:putative per-hexamer repeat protein 5 [Lingula anatina]|uniref:Per-hexamer repeat protein 5 n=1 Tax=Lingula anatina TaxID=7574 RepID=A0A2R2MKN7_LINAN|nr:putative per-hexamer repeat protein 5 [Lingula anatina]|eukprot:XP_023930779.1 putative per-hexamer repeat protein 5 [Lingula anatina]